MTVEDWAPYGIGIPDAEGVYPDYRTPPEHLRPEGPSAGAAGSENGAPEIDGSWLALVTNWRLVVAELAERRIDLFDPAVLAGPWLGVRTVIFSLLDSDTRLRRVLTRR